ncbi:uncharacterized protein [Dendrobates tinctorius]|uniref:uncharacterized protein n=1 Tax=Dendrobates tinctorius TaxID=92724 RepID=UPI003CC96124
MDPAASNGVQQQQLQDILPSGYDYHVESFKEGENEGWFHAKVRANIFAKEAEEWLQRFHQSSHTDLRVSQTTQLKLFLGRYSVATTIQEQTSSAKQCHKKHTNCGATLSITVRNMAMKRSKDKLLSTHPCVICINHEHNHAIYAADALHFRRPSPEVEEVFRILFAKGHSPSTALQSYKFDLQEQFGDQAFLVLSDRSKCPDISWCYQHYYSTFQRQYGPPDGLEMISRLKMFIHTYNNSCGSVCAKVELEEDKELIIAICSPLMQRVHKYLPASGEIAFMDSSGSMDRHNSRIFILLAPSVAGALPLAILVMFSETSYYHPCAKATAVYFTCRCILWSRY